MDDTGGVDRGQRPGHPDREALQTGGRERAAPDHDLLERRAVDELAGHPGRVVVEAGVEHGRGAEPGHPAGRVDLVPEPLAQVGLAVEVGPDRLHRDPAPALPLTEVDDTHPALAEPAEQAVGPERGRVAGEQGRDPATARRGGREVAGC